MAGLIPPRCTHCQRWPAFSTQAGTLAMAEVVGLDGRVIRPASTEVQDVHWCWACWSKRYAPDVPRTLKAHTT